MSILDLNDPKIKSKVYVKTNIGGWFFDAYLRMTHSSQLKMTEHPVQAGASLTDHAFLQPRTLTIEVGMTDVAQSYIPGQFSGGQSRSIQAYRVLMDLQAMRIPIQVHTRLHLYQNMLIEVLSAPDDYTTRHGLRCSVTFKEVLVAQVKTVRISARPEVTDSSKRGKQEPAPVKESLMANMGLLPFGKTFTR